MPESYLFAGPSLPKPFDKRLGGAPLVVRAPVARGDIRHLADTEPPGVVIMADGRFHDAMSVGHAELRNALQRGWEIWGVSSIGAIRAFELRNLGMRGSGRVYELFFRVRDFQDDEVAMLHSPDPPYAPGSEPLIHLRVALAFLVRRGFVKRDVARQIARHLKSLWYGDRTLALFSQLVREGSQLRAWDEMAAAISPFEKFRVKEKDLAALLTARPWRRDRDGAHRRHHGAVRA